MLLRVVAVTTLLTGTYAFDCHTGGDALNWDPSLTDTCIEVCFHMRPGKGATAGCLPLVYASEIDTSQPMCNSDACWCLTANCNTAAWLAQIAQMHPVPQSCFLGVAGVGAKCEESQFAMDNKFEHPSCYERGAQNMCVENTKSYVGMGDGCPDEGWRDQDGRWVKRDQASCESYQPEDGRGDRDQDDSHDGTTRHCRWIPEKTDAEKDTDCVGADKACQWYSDRGEWINDVPQGNCEFSEESNQKAMDWDRQRGMECRDRLKSGCFENNDHLGGSERCTDHGSEGACLAEADGCWEGTCSGTYTGADGRECPERGSECDCDPTTCGSGSNGCSWTPQCCKWLPPSTDKAVSCATHGAGTLDGVCQFNDGGSLPDEEFLGEGFGHGLWNSVPTSTGKCGLIASFRNGYGSAVVLDNDTANMVASQCMGGRWKDVAEHTEHTEGSIDEYCENFIPDASAMAALSAYSPGCVITKAKQGQFGTVVPGLQDLLYIVTTQPDYGLECLFFAQQGAFGAAVCTCDGADCNSEDLLKFIVNPEEGPMRLLQFLDGTLADKATAVNGIVPDLLDAGGRVNPSTVNSVSEANVDEIMGIDGIAEMTNKKELWGIIQDFQGLLSWEAAYTSALQSDSTFNGLNILPEKVAEANAKTDCPVYAENGMPNTFCLQHLKASALDAVAAVTGIAKTYYEAGAAHAKNVEEAEGCIMREIPKVKKCVQISRSLADSINAKRC